MLHDRRAILAALGMSMPFGIDACLKASSRVGPVPLLSTRSFEEAVREAFAGVVLDATHIDGPTIRRIEIGHSDEVLAGIQGCSNDRLFAGFSTGRLRIVRIGAGPGPVVQGVRLYMTVVDIALTNGRSDQEGGRRLDFSVLPSAPYLSASQVPAQGKSPASARAKTDSPSIVGHDRSQSPSPPIPSVRNESE